VGRVIDPAEIQFLRSISRIRSHLRNGLVCESVPHTYSWALGLIYEKYLGGKTSKCETFNSNLHLFQLFIYSSQKQNKLSTEFTMIKNLDLKFKGRGKLVFWSLGRKLGRSRETFQFKNEVSVFPRS
jgi:hypothetical protein